MEEPKRESKLSLLIPEMRRIVLRISRAIAAGSVFRGRKVLGDVFETLRSRERQKYLVRKGVSFTQNSYHLRGLAVDIVLSGKGLRAGLYRVFNYFWNSPLYDELNKIMVDEGLRSLGATHNFDLYHAEMPIIFQGTAPHCFAYVVINALQKTDEKWRIKSKDYCYKAADKLQNEVKSKRMLQSVQSALEVAHNFGWIKGYERIDKDEWNRFGWWQKNNQEGVIISQKRKVLGKNPVERWNKHKKRISEGRGIANHTSLLGFADDNGIHTRNSHEHIPTYVIKHLSEIQVVYRIINS